MDKLIKVILHDKNFSDLDTIFLVSTFILTQEIISNLREVENHWFDYQEKNYNFSFDLPNHKKDCDSFCILKLILEDIQSQSIGLKVEITKDELIFWGNSFQF